MDNKAGSKHGEQVVRKYTKCEESLGNVSKHSLLFSHDMVNDGPQNVSKTVIFPNALFFYTSPGIC